MVDRSRPHVYGRLRERFAQEPTVRVMFDRRSQDATPERRLDEDDARANLWDEGG